MHGHARHLHTRLVGVADSVRALERRQQRRVQVQHAVGEGVQHHGRELAHVARHRHVLRARRAQLLHDARVGGQRVGVHVAVERHRGDTRRPRALDAVRVRPRRDHLHDIHRQPLIAHRVDDGLQVRSAAGKQHPDLQRLHRASLSHVSLRILNPTIIALRESRQQKRFALPNHQTGQRRRQLPYS